MKGCVMSTFWEVALVVHQVGQDQWWEALLESQDKASEVFKDRDVNAINLLFTEEFPALAMVWVMGMKRKGSVFLYPSYRIFQEGKSNSGSFWTVYAMIKIMPIPKSYVEISAPGPQIMNLLEKRVFRKVSKLQCGH